MLPRCPPLERGAETSSTGIWGVNDTTPFGQADYSEASSAGRTARSTPTLGFAQLSGDSVVSLPSRGRWNLPGPEQDLQD
jgi:hypothetical protein